MKYNFLIKKNYLVEFKEIWSQFENKFPRIFVHLRMFIDYSGFLKLFEDYRVVNSTNVVNNGFEGFLLFRVRLKVQTDNGENFQELCKV